MKPRLYLETTVPSYLTSRPSRDLIVADHQLVTRDWWDKRRGDFQIYISQSVLDEVSAGDPAAARQPRKILNSLPLLDITPEVADLASGFLTFRQDSAQRLPPTLRISRLRQHGMDLLVISNCVHIANA